MKFKLPKRKPSTARDPKAEKPRPKHGVPAMMENVLKTVDEALPKDENDDNNAKK